MSKISRVSSLKSSRIRSSHVNRLTTPQQVEEIEPLSPAANLQNKTAYPHENQLLDYDIYYEKIKELKKDFKTFHRNKQALIKAITDFDSITQNPTNSLEDVINKYNETILSLEAFDKAAGTNLAHEIKQIPFKYRSPLKKVGIELLDNKIMYLDKEVWKQKDNYRLLLLNQLFKPKEGMMHQLLQAFQSLKIDSKASNLDIRGLVIDDKS